MNGTIISFRRGRHTISHNQMIIQVNKIDDKEKALGMVGKHLIWKSPAGKEIKGTISNVHGNKGALRAIFEKGMPGQSVLSSVEIVE